MSEKKQKTSDVNNKPVIVLLLAILFIGVSIAMYILGAYKGENGTILTIIMILFGALGVYFLIFGIYRAVVMIKISKLKKDPNAFVTTATFDRSRLSGYTGRSVGFGSVPIDVDAKVFKKIFYTYSDEDGVPHSVKSKLSFTPNQVNYLQQKQTFKIKCKGGFSIITENIPSEESLIKFNLINQIKK